MSEKLLKQTRQKIDTIDERILDLLHQRVRVVRQIGKIKAKDQKAIYAPDREKAVLDRLTRENRGVFPAHALRAVFREIFSVSRSLQSPLKVAFLGPEASFTHLATLKHFGRSTDLVAERSIAKVFDAVEHDRAVCGVVPIENSTEGVVGATLDRFIESPLKILGEIVLPISHNLLSREKSVSSIRRIYSHPQAIAQCRTWLDENMPNIPVMEVDSTAKAAERAASEKGSAGIAGEHAVELYGLKNLKKHIEDNPNNMTRFVVIGHKSPASSKHDKTSVLFSVKDEVGILYRMLEPFYRQKINLTKIESRPLRKKVWEYIFFLDMDGHVEDRKVRDAIQGLEKRCLFMKILGSYPKATS